MIFNMTGVAGGGGAALNFKIVGGTTQPSSASENTIWVNTDEEITSWIFSVTEPTELVEGMVWIVTGTDSGLAFNALKKNAIYIYPLSAKQYVGGKWNEIEMYINQNGSWDEVITTTYIFQNGAFTKGSLDSYISNDSSDAGILDGFIGLYAENGSVVFCWATEKYDISNYSKIIFVVKSMEYTTNGGTLSFDVCLSADSQDPAASISVPIQNSSSITEHVLDVSSLDGSYYVRAGIERSKTGNSSVAISEIRLEA